MQKLLLKMHILLNWRRLQRLRASGTRMAVNVPHGHRNEQEQT